MAYRYKALTGAAILLLFGAASYSIAQGGYREKSYALVRTTSVLDPVITPTEEEEETPPTLPNEEIDKMPAVDEGEANESAPVVPETPEAAKPVEDAKPTEEPTTPKEETPQVAEATDKDLPKDTTVSTDPNDTTTDPKGQESEEHSNGEDYKGGPRTVSENPENKKIYKGMNIAAQRDWKIKLLDTTNASWWIPNEKQMIARREDRILTEPFRKVYYNLKAKGVSALDGKELMELCKTHYKHDYVNYHDDLATDIWLSCQKIDNK